MGTSLKTVSGIIPGKLSSSRFLAVACASVLSGLAVTQNVQADPYEWKTAGSGNWDDVNNWNALGFPGGYPEASFASGRFDSAIFNATGVNADQTIYLNTTDRTTSTITIKNTGSTSINGGSVSAAQSGNSVLRVRGNIVVEAGAGPVTFGIDNTAVTSPPNRMTINFTSSYKITNDSSSSVNFWQTITAPGDTTIPSRTLTLDGSGALGIINGGINGNSNSLYSLVKDGTGTWQIGNNTYAGSTTINAGTLKIRGDNALGAAGTASTVTINSGTIASVVQARTVPATKSLVIGGDFGLSGAGFGTHFLGTVDLGGAVRTATIGSGGSTLSGVISNGGLTKTGPNTLTLTAANTYAGGTTVSAGTLVAGHGDALGGGSLSIATGATTQVQAGLPKALSVSSVTFAGTGKLDVTNNTMVVTNSTLAAVQAAVIVGYNNGDWLGNGLTSSTAAADTNFLTTLGYASNADLFMSSIKGVTLDGDDIVVKHTYYGDADLSGDVTTDDFSFFLNGYQNPSTTLATWINGDFDYSGTINIDDFGFFLHGYQNQGAPLTLLADLVSGASGLSAADRQSMLASIAAVPEPASLGLLALAGAGVLGRRRRA